MDVKDYKSNRILEIFKKGLESTIVTQFAAKLDSAKGNNNGVFGALGANLTKGNKRVLSEAMKKAPKPKQNLLSRLGGAKKVIARMNEINKAGMPPSQPIKYAIPYGVLPDGAKIPVKRSLSPPKVKANKPDSKESSKKTWAD